MVRRAALQPDWAELERDLTGQLILPESAAYETARKPFIARFDGVRPRAITRCAVATDVMAVVRFAARHGIELAVRSGGHSLAGLSSTTGILVDVSPMNAVTVVDGLAHIGAGARLGEIYEQLLAQGVTVPAGTCPSVGIAGLTLGGGFGLLGRKYGLTLDHLVHATVVLADGRVAQCDEENDPDLFWALRGAGSGNFGVATTLVFRTVNAPSRLTNFDLRWPFARAMDVVLAWQAWAPSAPDELCAELEVSAGNNPEELPVVAVHGTAMASEADTRQLLDELVSRVGVDPSADRCRENSYRETVFFHGAQSVSAPLIEETPNGPVVRQGYRSGKSEFFDQLLPTSSIAPLLANLDRARRRGEIRSLYLAPWGGDYNRRAPDSTAFAHRSQLFLIEHSAFTDPRAAEGDKSMADEWVNRSWASVHAHASGRVYPAFPELELDHWASAYYGDNLARLLRVKATYDPGRLFRTPQTLTSGTGSAGSR